MSAQRHEAGHSYRPPRFSGEDRSKLIGALAVAVVVLAAIAVFLIVRVYA
jgi:hypothetical protein